VEQQLIAAMVDALCKPDAKRWAPRENLQLIDRESCAVVAPVPFFAKTFHDHACDREQ
jgi:hypothetical protein